MGVTRKATGLCAGGIREVLVDLVDDDRALADGGGDSFDRSAAYIARGEDSRQARRSRCGRVRSCLATGQDESPLVALHRWGEPLGVRLGPDQHEQPCGFEKLL